jgi:hypothetical protein
MLLMYQVGKKQDMICKCVSHILLMGDCFTFAFYTCVYLKGYITKL